MPFCVSMSMRKLLKKFKPRRPAAAGFGCGVMDRGGKILDLHAADRDRIKRGERRFDDAVGSVKGSGFELAI